MTVGRLGDATWVELVGAAARPVLVVPLGSCEQHGPHLPIDTDTRIAVALAERLAAVRPTARVTPAVAFGASWEHAGLPGLLSLDHRLLAELLVELARSADWASGVVLVNGHGGNARAVHDAVVQIRAEGRRVLGWSPRVEGGDAHAGRTETSILLALDPHAVRRPLPPAGWTGGLDEVGSRGVAAVSPSGILGDPTEATAEEGHRVLGDLTSDLVATFDRWHLADGARGPATTR